MGICDDLLTGMDTENGLTRVLVLGGSWFVGRAVVAEPVERGHDVTVFNRGVSHVTLPKGVRHVG
jgi:uncharacterized protein YbjT (DUF2867 family)